MINGIKRTGSLLFEILLGISALIFIMAVTMPTIRNEQYLNDFNKYLIRTNLIIKDLVIDPYKGYPSANNNYCAPDHINSFKDITVYRIVKCSNLDTTINYFYDNANTNNEKNATKSFFYDMNNWIGQYSNSDYGCKLYIGEGNTTTNFNLYFDCSQIKRPSLADTTILMFFKKNYPTQLIGYDMNGLSIDPNYIPTASDHPSDKDGKILLNFQK